MAEIFQRLSGVRIQQKDHFKQHGLNDLSGSIMTGEEMRHVAILAWKHFRAECSTSSNADLGNVYEKWIF